MEEDTLQEGETGIPESADRENPGASQSGLKKVALETPELFPARALIAYARAALPGLRAAAGGLSQRPSKAGTISEPANLYPHEDVLKAVPPPTAKPVPVEDNSQTSPQEVPELVVRAQGTPHLGGLSMVYETGFRPGQERLAAGKVSTGKNDPKGGVSYGAFQLSSLQHQPAAFLAHEGAPWASRFAGLKDTEAGGQFGTVWKSIAQSEPDKFYEAQHDFIKRTDYDPAIDSVKHKTGLDISRRSPAVQNVAWSMAVNHHQAPNLMIKAVQNLVGSITPDDPGYDKALINQMYDVRNAYVQKIGLANLQQRYQSERQAALDMLGR